MCAVRIGAVRISLTRRRISCPHAPISGRSRASDTPPACSTAPPHGGRRRGPRRAGGRCARRHLCRRRRTDRYQAARRARRAAVHRRPRRVRSPIRATSCSSAWSAKPGDSASASAPKAAEALKARDDLLVTDLRSIAVQGLVAPEHLPPLAEAKALLAWHARHRFCANCGVATDGRRQAGWRRDCPSCEAQHFPRTDPVVIMLAIRRRALPARPSHAFRAGHVVVPCRLCRAGRKRSRTRCAAKPSKRRASSAAASRISPRSRGRFRCR